MIYKHAHNAKLMYHLSFLCPNHVPIPFYAFPISLNIFHSLTLIVIEQKKEEYRERGEGGEEEEEDV